MSAILAVCGTAFCAMVSDGRMVEEPITDGKIKVLTDALPKVRKLNRNVLVGFAGDAVAAAQIINKLDEYDVQYMTLEKAVKVLQQAAQQTPCAPVGVRLLVPILRLPHIWSSTSSPKPPDGIRWMILPKHWMAALPNWPKRIRR